MWEIAFPVEELTIVGTRGTLLSSDNRLSWGTLLSMNAGYYLHVVGSKPDRVWQDPRPTHGLLFPFPEPGAKVSAQDAKENSVPVLRQ